MDVDSESSSPSSRLSVVCSASAEYSSNSSEGSSPNSRRNSINESVIKNEHYWERRKRNNDASRRSREKRRLNDLAMEEKILLLSAENERLKTQLETRETEKIKPALNLLIGGEQAAQFVPNPILQASSMLSLPLLQTANPTASSFPILQLSNTFPFQSTSSSSSSVPLPPIPSSSSTPSLPSSSALFTSSTSAFHPFRPVEPSSVIMRIERQSPDSTCEVRERQPQQQAGSNVIHRVGSPAIQPPNPYQQVLPNIYQQQPPQQQNQQQGGSLLSALLAQRRPSPTVPQSRTEHISGLNSPPTINHHSHNNGSSAGSKSDCESISSSASLSPSHSSEDHSNKSPQYVDRRKRNNEAAKRCRANRRAVFEYRSRRVQLLEGENDDLRRQIDSLRVEITHFKGILAQRATSSNG
ncbi:unnamed protein product [Caenorhabditis angaria]|uniref:BZIP domain-containing protein n=1 Tax=Caenorhabditis angaria TaxID=860376 RepID=A0A9P1I9C6_9PELO|nr:unnamed protein product [Caenorhabditis angaria]